MYLIRTFNHHRRDFIGELRCEFCKTTVTKSCYDDSFFHMHVIPAMVCSNVGCGKSTNSDPGKVPVQSGPRQGDGVVL